MSSHKPWADTLPLDRLVHEYMRDASDFAAALEQAKAATLMLVDTYNRLRDDLPRRLTIDENRLPASLS